MNNKQYKACMGESKLVKVEEKEVMAALVRLEELSALIRWVSIAEPERVTPELRTRTIEDLNRGFNEIEQKLKSWL